ncbi:MAG: hypothetical protein ACI959_001662 [Limisphaerales bacterium]|jgi:hypothetical protein
MEEVVSKGVIPEEYSRRFEINALQDASQLAGREVELEAIDQAWKNWSVTANPLLIIGEGGCGMSSLINSETYEVPPVVIIENVERLFRRRVNGFNLLDDILLFIHTTKEKIFWVASINQYAAYYLNEVRNFANNFPSKLHIPPLGEEIIEELINDRNEGYEWFFLKPENTPNVLQ